MGYVKKSIAERTQSSGTESGKHDTSSRSGNDKDVDDADIIPIYDKEPMAEDAEQCQVKSPLLDPSLDNKTTKFSNQSLKSENMNDHNESLIAQLNKKSIKNVDMKAQIQEKEFANAALKNKLRELTRNSVDTKFAKLSILGKPPSQSLKNQSVVRQPTAFKSERPNISKSRESVFAKPHHVIAPGSSKNSSKNVSPLSLKESFGSNDMVHNYYLEEARKKTQERNRNSKPSVMPSVRL
ncbi:hypothetical protein Tco_0871851 [Tanacetum coccineum]